MNKVSLAGIVFFVSRYLVSIIIVVKGEHLAHVVAQVWRGTPNYALPALGEARHTQLHNQEAHA